MYDVLTRCCGECYTWQADNTSEVARHIMGSKTHSDAVDKLARQLETGNCGVSSEVDLRAETLVQTKPGLVRFGGVYLPHWVLHPIHAEMKVIQQLWKWYTYGWLPGGLLDLWIEHVFPIYLQDTSMGSDCFWDDACDKVDKIIKKAEQIACDSENSRWYTVNSCRNGQSDGQDEHAHLALKATCGSVPFRKNTLAQWLKLFPVSSEIDFDKQRLHVHNILHAYKSEYRGMWRKRANEVLSNIPIGTSYVWMCSQLLWQMLGRQGYATVWDSWSGEGLCKLDDLTAQKALKEPPYAVPQNRSTPNWSMARR